MSDGNSIQFRNKSISQLVQELNQLGDENVAMHPFTLIGVHEKDQQGIRRFRSKSASKNQTLTKIKKQKLQQQTICQFFLTDGSQKKYYYNDITNDLEILNIGNIMTHFQRGFNVSILMQFNSERFAEVVQKIGPWFEDINGNSACLANFMQFRIKDIVDLLNEDKTNAIVPLQQWIEPDFYEIEAQQILKSLRKASLKNIKILRLKNSEQNNAETRIILFPDEFISQTNSDPNLRVIKNQLLQILNYIKTNPNKRYEHINKLLPKRHPITTIIAQLILYDSANFAINWVNDNIQTQQSLVNGRFDFFDKFTSVTNFIKKVQNKKIRVIQRKKKTDRRSSRSPNINQSKNKNRQVQKTAMDAHSTKPLGFDYSQSRMSELQYCRSLERKTHKYSISQFQSQNDLFNENMPKPAQTDTNFSKCNESEAITILKSQHARQVSQYHQTIQNLNKKIMILTSEKGLQEIYTIHERQIMLLELKIQELRDDISKLCGQQKQRQRGKSSKRNQQSNLKMMIKKLNNQIKVHQKSNTASKLSQGRIKMLQKELSQIKQKYQQSQIARKELTYELQALTKRLKIKDQQIISVKAQQPANYIENDLSSKEQEQYHEIIQILNTITNNKEGKEIVIRKVMNILGDLSGTRQIVLQCNNFLVQLQQHIQSRLSEKDPDVVLDCNRFIRSYLLNNLNIF